MDRFSESLCCSTTLATQSAQERLTLLKTEREREREREKRRRQKETVEEQTESEVMAAV